MKNRAQPSVRRSTQAGLWNELWTTNELPDWDTLCQDVYDVLVAEIGDLRGKHILEAGSGSGRISMRLAQEGAKVTLLDFSVEALVASQRRYAARNVVAEYVEGSIVDMPFGEGTFDVVFNTGVLEHYTPVEQVTQLQEMVRVLKPGGLLIVFVPYAKAALYQVNKWFQERNGTWQHDYENPLWEILPLLNQVGLEGAHEYTAAFNTLSEIGRGFEGGNSFSAYQEFWYHQLLPEERKNVPGYLLVGVGRKPGGAPECTPDTHKIPVALPHEAEIVVLSSVNWDYLWQRPQQMAKQFSALGHRTIFVNGSQLELSINQHTSPQQLMTGLSDNTVRTTKWDGETAIVWPITRVKMDEVQEDITDAWLNQFLKLFDLTRPVFWTISHQWGDHVDLLKRHGLVVYDCVDELSGFSWATPAMLDQERKLFEGADIITVSAQALLQKRMQERQQVYLVPNGVNPEQFQLRSEKNSERTVIGFLGALANWVDTELVANLADANPNWTILLVGSNEGADLRPLQGKPNVILTGRVPYDQVPVFLQEFDVGIIPFKVNDLTHNANPIKVYEYMAAGLPVVMTPFSEHQFFGDRVLTASSVEEFTQEIQKALSSRTPEEDQERQAFARQNSWRTRALVGSTIAMVHNHVRREEREAAAAALCAGLEAVSGDPLSAWELQVAAADANLAHLVTDGLERNPEQLGAAMEGLLERHAYSAALALARQMYEEHPENSDVAFNLAVLLSTAGEMSEAIPLFLNLAGEGDASVYPYIASALQSLGHQALTERWISLVHSAEEGGAPKAERLNSLISETRAALN